MQEYNPLETTTLQCGDGTTILTTSSDSTTQLREQTPFEVFTSKLGEDMDYAWSWHCNIAMMIYDSSHAVDSYTANVTSAQFMNRVLEVDVTKTPMWASLTPHWTLRELPDVELSNYISGSNTITVALEVLDSEVTSKYCYQPIVRITGACSILQLSVILEQCRRHIKTIYYSNIVDDILELHNQDAIHVDSKVPVLEATSKGTLDTIDLVDVSFSILQLAELIKQLSTD